MESEVPGLAEISDQLLALGNSKKPKMLVVDDEPDNLDLLYRTFRRSFQVLKAESGMAALEILATEGEVAVIISDQRMPEMKGTEFLSKTVPQFPDTVRIILTGFTDVEDLVDAINSGQVYKYITKPWDPNELKTVVQRAAETYNLYKQRAEELRRAQAQTQLLSAIVHLTRQSGDLSEFLHEIAVALQDSFSGDSCIVQRVQNGAIASEIGVSGITVEQCSWLAENPLLQKAIATQAMQAIVNIPTDAEASQQADYQATGIQAHLVVPVTFAEETLAILSLQWMEPCPLSSDELTLLYLSAQQIALALACTQQLKASS
jgi:CheY-like chemotaxis protein